MDLESRLRLEGDAPAVEEFLASVAGQLHRREEDPLGLYWVVLQPRNGQSAPFTARFSWTVYPHRPPSLTFTDTVGGTVGGPTAWPAAGGYRSSPGDVCKPFTAEGQALHPEWTTGPRAWRASGNPFLYVVQIVQDDIDREDGRRAG